MSAPLRLSPTSASRVVLALEFVRRYFLNFGRSPSFGEIAAELDVPIQRISAIIRQLEEDGEVLRTPGRRRGLRLPDRLDELADSEVMLLLKRRGWLIGFQGPPEVAP